VESNDGSWNRLGFWNSRPGTRLDFDYHVEVGGAVVRDRRCNHKCVTEVALTATATVGPTRMALDGEVDVHV
jgi:hypothetical protein